MDEYSGAPEVAVVDFFQSVLPAVSSDIVGGIMAHLVATGRFFGGDTPSWNSFPVRSSELTSPGNDALNALGGVYSEIIGAFKHLFPGTEEAVALVQCPYYTTPPNRLPTARSGGYFILTDENSSQANCENIVVTCEFKSPNQVRGDEQSIKNPLWGMHHVMCDDYRRFTFGLTIEDFTTRIWFCDRSENMVSEPFELDKEPKLLVHFIVALAFSSHVDLGFDPTIERLPNGEIAILVNSTTNGTPVVTKYISDPQDDVLGVDRADFMNGRGTRVWRVRKEGNLEGVFYVLKESWIVSGQKPEGEFLREFREDIESKGATEDLALLDELFMGVDTDGLVELGPSKKDCTLETIRRGIPPRVDQDVKWYAPHQSGLVNGPPQSGARHGPWDMPSPSFTVTRRKTYRARNRYRVVFKGWKGEKEEVGKALHDLEDLRQILGCLPKLIDAIDLLYRYDRLHGDISTGNVIVRTDRAGNVTDIKLSDLEYARKGTGEVDQGTRTGTYQFMSVEVYLGGYLCRPAPKPIGAGMERRLTQAISPPPSFRHNVLHELESVWWIMIWVILHKYQSVSTGYSLGPATLVKLQEQKELLFDRPNWMARQRVLRLPDNLAGVLDLLPQSPIIVTLASQFRFGQSPFNWWYADLMSDWDKREELFADALEEFRQFALDLVQYAAVSD